ncbi:hypothetical protein RchiOBHm_Chr7g0211431 [Rosa chinensis]|uniref:Uncharacterized protein n=1 Tax=Rosa chinensis TaxID=74649 RepID=A0A2P6PAG0_ROSCH|nr:hypothetical protein RchiOBHm_Chr7g0211431 [Rosa chinensis]
MVSVNSMAGKRLPFSTYLEATLDVAPRERSLLTTSSRTSSPAPFCRTTSRHRFSLGIRRQKICFSDRPE